MSRESMVFYRSFVEGIAELDEKDQLEAFWNILNYALDGQEPEGKGAAKAIFKMAKPQIDKNNQKYENGKKGGRNKTNCEPTLNQTETKAEPKTNQTEPDEEKDEANVNDNVNDNVINYQLIADMYNDTCVSFPRLTRLSDRRKKALRARIKAGYTIDDFQRLFQIAEESDFLKGGNSKDWNATFDWLIQDGNMAKVLDGNYNRASLKGQDKGGESTYQRNRAPTQNNSFHNFEQRNYDYDALEKKLIGRG